MRFAKTVVFTVVYYALAAIGVAASLYISVQIFDLLAIQLRWIGEVLGL